MTALLEVEGLSVRLPIGRGMLHAVRDVSFAVDAGQTLCLVGESGCGKSLTSLAVMDLLPGTARRTARRMEFDGSSMLESSRFLTSQLRGKRIAMIFQDPMTSLNPVYTVGEQLMEGFIRHSRTGRAAARHRAVELLEKVGISNAERRLAQYPHQLSGGLRQRVMIAMALMCEPELLIADEPTTALDVTIQGQILNLLKDLQRDTGLALIMVTHDLGVVAQVADNVGVMYAGEIVEYGSAQAVFSGPSHPYTRGLLACLPAPGMKHGSRLGTIPGVVPSLIGEPSGCAFVNRCQLGVPECRSIAIPEVALNDGRLSRCLFANTELAHV